MNEDVKKYGIMLFISIIVLIIELIFKIKGVIGLILCIASIYFIIALSIRILRLTNLFNEEIMEKIDILFFL
ncbi:hypothetical protein EGP99_02890 [bacterium]|jgi:hypothetical protein|nr:hypothetical protein [bacterium]